jgi:hypothetical protein
VVAAWAAIALPDPASGTPHPTHKLVAPVEIEFTAGARRKGDTAGTRRLRVEVTPRVDATRVEVVVTLPAGVSLVKGPTRWAAPARARQALTRDLVLKVPATGERRVVATARLLTPRGLPKTRTASFAFNARIHPADPAGLPTTPIPSAPGRTIRRSE